MMLTDTRLLNLIEKHCFEIASLDNGSYWRVWINASDQPIRAPTLRAALHLAHTEVVTRLLHPEI